MPNTPETRPHIIIDSETDIGTAARIKYLDRRIHEDPQTFVMAFNLVGRSITHETVPALSRQSAVRSLKRRPADLILEYFKSRYDLDSNLDPETERAIDEDPENKVLIAAFRTKRAERVKVGEMKTVAHSHAEEAVDASNAVRRSRFGIYLGRVAAYNASLAETRIQIAAILEEVQPALEARSQLAGNEVVA